MNATITRSGIAAGYVVAGLTLCLGIYFGIKAEGDAGTILVRGFYVLAGIIVLKFTFDWGRIRGFSARREDRSINVSNVMRNLVMSLVVAAVLSLIFAPIMMLAFKFAR